MASSLPPFRDGPFDDCSDDPRLLAVARDVTMHRCGMRERDRVAPKSFLLAVARQQLTLARNAAAGWSARAVCDGESGPLRHLVVALREGESLSATLTADSVAWTAQVLQGRVCLTVGRARRFGWPGELLAGPRATHQLLAECDAVVLITLVMATS